MHRPRQCEDGNRIQNRDRQGANARPDCPRRQEQTTSWARLNPECVAGVDETLAGSVQPGLCRRRSPTDADRDRQFDPEKALVLPTRRAPDAIQRVRSGPYVSARNENYRCSQCMRPINDRLTLLSASVLVAARTRSSTAGPTHTTHEKS